MLQRYNLSRTEFNRILTDNPLYEDIDYGVYQDCMRGGKLISPLKKTGVYRTVNPKNQKEYILIRASKLYDSLGWSKPDSDYSTYAIYADDNKAAGTSPDTEEMTGPHAYRYMLSVLRKVYTDDEIDACFRAHEAEKCKPLHSILPIYYEENMVHRFDSCVYYDINSAYGAALCEIFPKAKSEIENIYLKRKVQPKNKKILNYFVGMLAHPNPGTPYIGTYYWIVNRTRNILAQRIIDCDGELLYSNTDGAIIHAPKIVYDTDQRLGEFKSELKGGGLGTVYIYKQHRRGYTPYILMGYETDKGFELKGTCAGTLRAEIDIQAGRFPLYIRGRERILDTDKYITTDTLTGWITEPVQQEEIIK